MCFVHRSWKITTKVNKSKNKNSTGDENLENWKKISSWTSVSDILTCSSVWLKALQQKWGHLSTDLEESPVRSMTTKIKWLNHLTDIEAVKTSRYISNLIASVWFTSDVRLCWGTAVKWGRFNNWPWKWPVMNANRKIISATKLEQKYAVTIPDRTHS